MIFISASRVVTSTKVQPGVLGQHPLAASRLLGRLVSAARITSPESVIRRKFATEIRKEVIDGLLPERFSKGVNEMGVKPVGQPQVTELTVAEFLLPYVALHVVVGQGSELVEDPERQKDGKGQRQKGGQELKQKGKRHKQEDGEERESDFRAGDLRGAPEKTSIV